MRAENNNLQNSIGKCEEVERQLRLENSALQYKVKSHCEEVILLLHLSLKMP